MKKVLLLAFAFGIYAFNHTSLLAQSSNPFSDIDPALPLKPSNTGSTKAMWDVEFSYDITAQVGSSGNAGGIFVNNEYWVSKWASDTLFRLNNTGTYVNTFTIAGLSAIRSMTYDGAYVYASNNTGTIYRIDPSTATLAPPHINTSVTPTVRFASFDSTLNGNAGGFWVGNFNTDIFAIDMNGGLISSIAAGVHTLTGMYGAAFDNQTSGGPYLWVFSQSGTNNSQITRVTLSSGNPGINHDAFTDISGPHSLTSSLAGGIFITDQVVSGEWTLVGVAQGTPNNVLVGYDLDDVGASVNNLEELNIHIYPNPTTDFINLVMEENGSYEFKIMDIAGRTIRTGMINGSNQSIDVSTLANGSYVLQLAQENQIIGYQTIIKN